MIYRPTKAYLSLPALATNLKRIKSLAPGSKIMAVIKANGYGHGLYRVARQLSEADAFAVTSLEEALQLRQMGFLHRIVLLEGLFSAAELPVVIQNRLDLVVHAEHQLNWLLASAPNASLHLWIKIDTGMHRLGFAPEQVAKVVAALQQSGHAYQLRFLSHLASADENKASSVAFTQAQHLCFVQTCAPWPFAKSLANSAGIIAYPESHYEWVRPGIALFGSGLAAEHPEFEPVMRLESAVLALRWVPVGETVGYGQAWQAPRPTLVAVVAIGYADGYPRTAVSGTPVLIRGRRVGLIGRVSMDMITVDVTELAEQITIGDRVILWGDPLLRVDEVAQYCGTLSYELLTGISPRVPFIEVS
ncbi:MAG: alanine racemase [Thiotrichales bacterium]|nr:alanine racemase [Thiotrichales bacterium]